MHCAHVVVLRNITSSQTSQFVHVSASAQKQTQMFTQCSYLSSGLDRDPHDSHLLLGVPLDDFGVLNVSDSQFFLDSRNQRGTLEDGSLENLDFLFDFFETVVRLERIIQLEDAYVLFACVLLTLGEAGGGFDADDEHTGDFGVESPAVAGLVHFQNAFDPRDDLVRRGVRRFVQIELALLQVVPDVAFQRVSSVADGRPVPLLYNQSV